MFEDQERIPYNSEEDRGFEQAEIERLELGVQRIILSRERTPRTPQWNHAWWRALIRYNARLSRLRARERLRDPQVPTSRWQHEDNR